MDASNQELSVERAPREHVDQFGAPLLPRSQFDRALLDYLALAPRSGITGKRDGRRAAMLMALDCRTSWGMLRRWRRGIEPAPQWARELLAQKISARQSVLSRGFEAVRRIEKGAR